MHCGFGVENVSSERIGSVPQCLRLAYVTRTLALLPLLCTGTTLASNVAPRRGPRTSMACGTVGVKRVRVKRLS
ncbi:hypothetical protein E2C01_014896 [Portunus trituberculatus]|uniref:Uncharacterized protein n=1 Tax=Portunus trituberculatus TaxID=210409 RepID=A0A5B7DLC6_PORTR|nr:hypothetical protein [Portunus trituberculatus]